MKTVYYTTDRFVRREGNVIDLCEYRERMQRAQTNLRPSAVGETGTWEEPAVPTPVFVPHPAAQRREAPTPKRRRFCLADLLELCASAGALVLVATVWVQFLL